MTSAPGGGGSRSISTHLVGRDPELTRLEAIVDEIVAGHRLGTVLVEGPAGIGKTSVVGELGARLQGRGLGVVTGHCVAQGERMLPYAPVVELLTELVRRKGPHAIRRAAGPAGPELARLVPALGDHEGSAVDSTRSGRLFQAVSTLLQNLSSHEPLLVVVEDLHWADTSTRELLALLARQQPGDVVLLLTLRTDETPAPPGLARYVAELVGRSDRRVSIQPLTREQQAHQISAILGVPPHRQLLDDVYDRAEGNPFFAEELLALAPYADASLPATVRDLLVARLETLCPATQQVLRTASAIGRTLPHRLLETVVDVSGDRLESLLRSAVDAHVLRLELGALSFRHALLQEAVAASLLPGEAARIHRRIAEALTENPALAGPRPRVAGRLARHWAEAGDRAQALVASVAAAHEATEALAFAEALSHYERVLELADTVPDTEALLDLPRARLLHQAAEVAHLAGHADRATELVRDAIAQVDPDDRHLHGALHERLGRYLWMSADSRHALAAYERAVELVPEDPPTRGRAAVLSGLSQMLMLADRFAESAALAREAIAVAAQVPEGRSVEGHARCNLGVALSYLGRLDDGIAELREARRIAEEQFDDVDDIGRAIVNLQSILFDHGRLVEAAGVGLESVRVTETLGLQRRKGVWSRCDAAQVLLLLGRWDEAGRLLDEAHPLQPQGIDAFRTDLVEGQLWLRRGDLDRARRLMERAETAGALIIDPHVLCPLYATLVELATWQGDDEAAARWSREGLGRLSHVVHPAHLVPVLAAAATAAARADPPRPTEARTYVDRAGSLLAADPMPGSPAAAEVLAARAELSGNPAAWREVVTAWERLGEPFRAAYAQLRTAEALLGTGAGRGEAAAQLGSAIATARGIGADGLVARAGDLARRARLSVEAAERNPYRLTGREVEVLRLVAEGLTDRAIGGRLFISHRTVERHVSNLLAKLGAARRSELVAVAHRERLLTPDSSAR